MTAPKDRLDWGIVIWLVALSFWSGVSFMQIQSNKEMLLQNIVIRQRMWDRIEDIRHDLSTIAGYIRGKNERDQENK